MMKGCRCHGEGGGRTSDVGTKMQSCRFYKDGKYSFAGSTGSKKYSFTVLPGEDDEQIYRPDIFLDPL